LSRDRDLQCYGGDLERQVGSAHLIDIELDAVQRGIAEACHVRGEIVAAWRQQDKAVVPGGIDDCAADDAGVYLSKLDRRSGERRSSFVCYVAKDRSRRA
jgi:hypothetical protein